MADASKNNKSRNRKKSGVKAVRVAARRRVHNLRRSRAVKDVVRNMEKLVVAKKIGDALKLLPDAYQAIDKAVKTGVLKMNTAGRMKSGLARSVSSK